MSSLKNMAGLLEQPAHPARLAARSLAIALLASAAAALARRANALASPRPLPPVSSDPRFEFHAEAGAPEGALYVDGELIGLLPGVSRL